MNNRRTFNLGNISARIANMYSGRYEPEETENINTQNQFESIPHIPRGISNEAPEESPIGSFLIRTILCITIFSLIMLMKNSVNPNVSAAYNVIRAWSTSNYSIPEEYGLEKFVDAIKSGDFAAVFSPISYPSIQFPTKGEVMVHYGEKDNNGAPCLGIMISSTEQNNVLSSINGTVCDIGSSDTLGSYVTVENTAGIKIIYGCCDEIMVTSGDIIDTDTIIAKMSEGNDKKYYVYMEVQSNEKILDPEKCFAHNS